MKAREVLIKTPEFWLETIQNEISRQITGYMEANNISAIELAEHMNVSEEYVNQIVDGEFNHSLSDLIELSLHINIAPIIIFDSIDSITAKLANKM